MKKAGLILFVIFIAGMAATSNADVIIKQKSTVETGSMMNAETESTEYIKNDRSCSNSKTKMTGGMASMMGGAPAIETIEITRLDKNVMWNLNPE